MQKYSTEKINQIKQLRRSGYSISELMKKFSMPKTTVWYHIHKIKLPRKYTLIIRSKQGGSKIRSQNEWEKAKQQAHNLLQGENRYYCSLLAMLYWAEGSRKGFVFANTDGQMIKFCILILKRYFNVDGNRIKLTLRIFENLNKKECLNYWSNTTGFPKNRFIIYLNDGGIRGKAKYGICRLSVEKSSYLLKLTNSLINSILQEIFKEYSKPR